MLKIDGFNGKFGGGGGVSAPAAESPAPASAPRAAGNAPSAGPRVGKPGVVRSFSLKQAMSETREEAAYAEKAGGRAQEEKRVKSKDAFTAEGVTTALRRYAESSTADHAVKVALTSHAPKVEGFVITLEVDNDFLLGRVNDLQPALLEFLMRQLNNGFIVLNVAVYVEPTDGKEQRRLFTAKDKLDYFLEKNPAVAELKSVFGLELE